MDSIVRSLAQKRYNPTGVISPWGAWAQYSYPVIFPPDVKTSVDTGKFIPGKYRVNPYYVSSYRVGEVCDGSFHLEAPSGVWTYIYDTQVTNCFSSEFLSALRTYVTSHMAPAHFEWASRRAIQASRAKVSGQMLTYGVEAGEFKETLQFLRHPLKTLSEVFSKRMIFGGPKDKLSRLTDAYLQYRFALQPLLNSVQDSFDVLSKGFPSFETGKIYSHHSRVTEEDATVGAAVTTGSPYVTIRTTPTISEKINYYGSTQVVYSVPPGLMDMLGLSLFDVPSIVWELTRLSFVIDRYIAIGPLLDSLRYVPGADILGGTLGVRRSIRCGSSSFEAKGSVGGYQPIQLPPASMVYESYDRTVNPENGIAINYGLSKDITSVMDEIALLLKATIK